MKVCGQKLVKFCAHTHTRGSISSKDMTYRISWLNYHYFLEDSGNEPGQGYVPERLHTGQPPIVLLHSVSRWSGCNSISRCQAVT